MASSITTETLISASKDIKGENIPSPFIVEDDPGALLKSYKEIKGSKSGGQTPLSTLESIAAAKISDAAVKPYKKYISRDLKPIGVEDSVSTIIDVGSLGVTGDPRLTTGEAISFALSKFSDRIDKYSENIKSKGGGGLTSLQISPQEVYSAFAQYKKDRFEQWDKGFVNYLKQLGPVLGMYVTPSSEYLVKVRQGPEAIFVKYFYDRRYYIAKQFRAPKQIGDYFPVYPINNLYFTLFWDEAEPFKNQSQFHYKDLYGFVSRKETKEKASPQGLVF